jgi:hypothetical protein
VEEEVVLAAEEVVLAVEEAVVAVADAGDEPPTLAYFLIISLQFG